MAKSLRLGASPTEAGQLLKRWAANHKGRLELYQICCNAFDLVMLS